MINELDSFAFSKRLFPWAVVVGLAITTNLKRGDIARYCITDRIDS
jgi:hypothetical protein